MSKPTWRTFTITKKSGKKRTIYQPNQAMQLVQKEIVKKIRSCGIELPSACGGVPGKSVVDHVCMHKTKTGRFNRHFFLVDLADAYDNTILSLILVRLGKMFPGEFTDDFNKHILEQCLRPGGGLITGASSASDLFNLYMEVFVDVDLRRYAIRNGLSYSRYMDDLVFSSDVPIGDCKRGWIIRKLMGANCVINHNKTRLYDLSKHPVVITGVGIASDGKIFVPRKKLATLKALLHRALEKGDVPESVVHGQMQMFMYLMRVNTIHQCRNSTEEKVYQLYLRYKARQV